jgi:N-acetyl-gamma-glutamyl-phosphate reductase
LQPEIRRPSAWGSTGDSRDRGVCTGIRVKTIKAGIVGGTGYSGIELLRILARHPRVELAVITSRKETGTRVAEFFPSLRGAVTLAFSDPSKADFRQCDIVFFATPNAVAMGEAASLLEAGVRVVDLSADFRIRKVAEWEKWYKVRHAAPELIGQAVYGLPEVNRAKIKGARLVANPGCYPTVVQLGLLPLVETGGVDFDHLIADAKSGVSGAGRKTEEHLLFSEASDNFKAYGVAGHRHWPEIRQGLEETAGREIGLTFVPHLTPMVRGIHATLYARITKTMDFQRLFEERYRGEPFVDVLPSGSEPDTRSVRAANTCRIAVHRPHGGDMLVVLSVIDNLVKGASGQAVQNMNIMFGFEETTGLEQIAVVP